jgi:hypothetical protein
MSGFIQIIEFKTSHIDEIVVLGEKFQQAHAAQSGSTSVRGTITSDRDRPGYYLNIVEFESYDAAMANSDRPETQEFSSKLMELCDGPPKFYNLDITQTWQG